LGDQAEEFDEILVKGHHTTVRGAQERATEHPAQQVRLFLVKGSHSLGHKSVVLLVMHVYSLHALRHRRRRFAFVGVLGWARAH